MKESTKAGRKPKYYILLKNGDRTDNPAKINANKRYILPSVLIFFLAFFTGCAYFNTFYNAGIYYETGVATIEAHHATGRIDIPTEARDAFTTAIEKSFPLCALCVSSKAGGE